MGSRSLCGGGRDLSPAAGSLPCWMVVGRSSGVKGLTSEGNQMRGGGRQLCQQRLIGDDKHLLCVLFWLSTSVTPDSVPWLDELPSPVLATLNLAESKFGLFLDNNE